MRRNIFLSYASPQSEAATRIELSLEGEGHYVFRDRSDLPPGESFDGRIRAAIEASDLFIFLISRESVSPGRYTLTELKFAEEKWQHPAGHVLPVLVEAVPKQDIPGYLRAVTMLQPRGDLVAEVAAAVERMAQPVWRRLFKGPRLARFVLIALLLAGTVWQGLAWYSTRRAQARHVSELVKQSKASADAGNYAAAWDLLERAAAGDPASTELIDAQEQLAMEWLQNARGSQLTGTLKDIAEKVSPVLSRGAIAGKGERSADLGAHLGWAEFLRAREGVGGLDPIAHYRRAADMDAENVFAHTMWGFEILRTGGSLADANQHFAIALQSKRRREYVRHMQVSALLWARDPELEVEAIRVANEMRKGGEPLPLDAPDNSDKRRLWSIYYFRLYSGGDKRQFLSALSPEDHLDTFRWLFPEEQIRKDRYPLYLYLLAQLQELNNERAQALASFRRLRSEVGNSPGRLLDGANAGIARLSK
jgi:hypothetical protein